MPCYDPEPAERLISTERNIKKITALLCEATAIIVSNGLTAEASDELKDFHVKHLADDKQRLKIERAKAVKEWYDKLTPHEKALVTELD